MASDQVKFLLAGAQKPPKNKNKPDLPVSLRFMFGKHTFFLIFSPLTPFSEITAELLECVRERYPNGLSSSVEPQDSEDTPVASGDVDVIYGVLVNKHNRDAGFRDLKIVHTDTPASTGLKDATDIAFIIHAKGRGEEKPVKFIVDWPKLDDDDEED